VWASSERPSGSDLRGTWVLLCPLRPTGGGDDRATTADAGSRARSNGSVVLGHRNPARRRALCGTQLRRPPRQAARRMVRRPALPDLRRARRALRLRRPLHKVGPERPVLTSRCNTLDPTTAENDVFPKSPAHGCSSVLDPSPLATETLASLSGDAIASRAAAGRSGSSASHHLVDGSGPRAACCPRWRPTRPGHHRQDRTALRLRPLEPSR
jgi:hypothetical protein